VRTWRARIAPKWGVASIPVYSIVLAFAAAAVVVIVSSAFTETGFDPLLPFAAYGRLFAGAFLSGTGIANTLVAAAPLMFGGLAVGLGLKAGLFNIGVAGQFLVGAFAAAVVGAELATTPTLVAMPLAMLAGAAGGAAYGFVPGYLKARTGAHEVVTTIMLNNVAVLLLTWAVNDIVRAPGFSFPRTGDIGLSALPVLLGRNLHLGIVFAVATVFLIRWILDRTTLGFEIRTVGSNPNAARYAGMRPVFITTLTMTISGLLAGLAGSIQMLGVIGFYAPGVTASVGFDSIAVALLGRSDPIGILFAAILFGAFRAGAPLMQIETSVPIEVIDIIQALVILFLAADLIVRRAFRVRAPKVEITEMATVTGSWGGTPPTSAAR
jgi:general nucleoside transport system permease protein